MGFILDKNEASLSLNRDITYKKANFISKKKLLFDLGSIWDLFILLKLKTFYWKYYR